MSIDVFLFLLYWGGIAAITILEPAQPTMTRTSLSLYSPNPKRICLSCNQKYFYQPLSSAQRRMRVRRITRPCLLSQRQCQWNKLFIGKIDSAMISLSGWRNEVFEELYQYFSPFFQHLSPHLNLRDD